MKHIKMEEQKYKNVRNNKKNVYRKRRVRSIPLTSKIPLYDKLLAEKEERFAFTYISYIYIFHILIFICIDI